MLQKDKLSFFHSEFCDCMRPKYSVIFRYPCCCCRPLGRPGPRRATACRPSPCNAASLVFTFCPFPFVFFDYCIYSFPP